MISPSSDPATHPDHRLRPPLPDRLARVDRIWGSTRASRPNLGIDSRKSTESGDRLARVDRSPWGSTRASRPNLGIDSRESIDPGDRLARVDQELALAYRRSAITQCSRVRTARATSRPEHDEGEQRVTATGESGHRDGGGDPDRDHEHQPHPDGDREERDRIPARAQQHQHQVGHRVHRLQPERPGSPGSSTPG